MRLVLASFAVAFSPWCSAVGCQTSPSAPTVLPRLRTQWTDAVDPSLPHPEYPRPQLVRQRWLNLNGRWDLTIGPDGQAARFTGRILVPFPIESALSGVASRLAPDERARYRRTFRVPQDWRPDRIWLRFGAADWETRVHVNGREVGAHRGGYDPFSFDVTDALRTEGEQELVVEVRDPTDTGSQPRGKQVLRPHGIWYTPSSGIWQTVWLEPVPARSIERVRLRTSFARARVEVRVEGDVSGMQVTAEVGASGVGARGAADHPLAIEIPDARPWSPDAPHLYPLRLVLRDGDVEVDRVDTYFGLRDVAVAAGEDGVPRVLLNGQPLFQLGTLDQGFWPDGLYTAPTDAALRHDLEVTKQLGFNMVRKHVKVEPATFYAHCDRLGLLVWQDMPSGDRAIGSRDADLERTAESAAQFEHELLAMVDALENHPSIVAWVPFNEGWGQFDTARIARLVAERDPTRLVDSASGWTDRGVGDVHDVHVYPGPGMPPREERRAAVLGEFGGLGLPVPGHTWQDEKNWGYRSFTSSGALTQAYVDLLEEVRFLAADGLCAAVYTQTTDVEVEVNGLLTYDRAQLKVHRERVRAANLAVHLPPPRVDVVAPCAEQGEVRWRFTTAPPPADWTSPKFDDAGWQSGVGGFGTPGTPGARVGTRWDTRDIWLRRPIELPEGTTPAELRLRVHHDEDVEVYVNGVEVWRQSGYATAYRYRSLREDATDAFRAGRNILAVHCRQTAGGQFVDVGLVRFVGGR